jgi:Family of unknown function (DUF5302)
MSDESGPADENQDVKEKFREALERKGKHATEHQSGGQRGDGAHGGTDTHAHGGKREFRRKSG